MKFFCWLSAFAALLATSHGIIHISKIIGSGGQGNQNSMSILSRLKVLVASAVLDHPIRTPADVEQNDWCKKLNQFTKLGWDIIVSPLNLFRIDTVIKDYLKFIKQRDQANKEITKALITIKAWVENPEVATEMKFVLLDYAQRLAKIQEEGNLGQKLKEIENFRKFIEEASKPQITTPATPAWTNTSSIIDDINKLLENAKIESQTA